MAYFQSFFGGIDKDLEVLDDVGSAGTKSGKDTLVLCSLGSDHY